MFGLFFDIGNVLSEYYILIFVNKYIQERILRDDCRLLFNHVIHYTVYFH